MPVAGGSYCRTATRLNQQVGGPSQVSHTTVSIQAYTVGTYSFYEIIFLPIFSQQFYYASDSQSNDHAPKVHSTIKDVH